MTLPHLAGATMYFALLGFFVVLVLTLICHTIR